VQKWINPASRPILPSTNAMTFFPVVLGYAFLLAQFSPHTHASPQNLRTETTTVNGHVTTLTLQSFGSKGTLGIEFSQPAKTSGPAPVSPTAASKPKPIKSGLTKFGNSYAAGFGTGRTTFDTCAQGQFSYGKFLAAGAPKGLSTNGKNAQAPLLQRLRKVSIRIARLMSGDSLKVPML
jgi:hypothetical protein